MNIPQFIADIKTASDDGARYILRNLLQQHRAQRPAYAKIGQKHRIALACVYVAIVLLVLVLFWRLGSQLHTRSLPRGSVSIQVEHSQYLVGEKVLFTVRNDYNAPMYVSNHCPYEPLDVYRWETDKWVRVHDEVDPYSCVNKDSHIKVAAKSSMTGSFAPWKNLFSRPGKYRLVVVVNYYDALPYTDFEVIGKPVVPEIPALMPPQPMAGNNSSVSIDDPDDHTPSPSPTPNPTLAPTPTPTPPPALQTKTITISAGTIVANYSSTTIYLQSVTPTNGTYETNRTQGSTIEVTFKRAGGGETQVRLRLTNGNLTYSIGD